MIDRSSFRRLVCSLPLGVVLACAGGADALVLNLKWSPSSDPGDVSSGTVDAFLGQRVRVLASTDERTNKKEIGANVESSVPRPVTTENDVAAYVTGGITDVLRQSHVRLAETGATRTLQAAVTEFYVKEGGMYNGTVVLTFTLRDGNGKQLWRGVGIGHSNRWGHSYSPDNYNETFSEATLEAVHDLMKNAAFLAAVRGQPSAPLPAAPPAPPAH